MSSRFDKYAYVFNIRVKKIAPNERRAIRLQQYRLLFTLFCHSFYFIAIQFGFCWFFSFFLFFCFCFLSFDCLVHELCVFFGNGNTFLVCAMYDVRYFSIVPITVCENLCDKQLCSIRLILDSTFSIHTMEM